MSASDVIVWLLLVVLSVLIFFLLPLAGGVAHLNRSGLKLIIAGIPIAIKLLHTVFSDQETKIRLVLVPPAGTVSHWAAIRT